METDTRVRSFDGMRFDPATGELTRPGAAAATRLPPKPARLLAMLLERPGELVAREEVVRELWPGQHLDVDQALAFTVRQVRAALGDEAGEPRWVETLPKRGYRFVGSLESGPAPAPGPDRNRAASGGRRNGPFVVAAILLLIGFFAWLWIGSQREERRRAGTVRIALLPLEAPGGNDRLTEALLVALAEYPELDVVGPATTAPLRATTRPHTEVGRELGVAFVASGAWHWEGRPEEGVLFLQLVRVSDGGHVFAERYLGTEDGVYRRLPEAAAGLAAAAREDAPALTG